MLMTVGDADTPYHPQFFRVPAPWHHQFFHEATFEPQRLTEDSATAVPSDSLRHGDVGECGTSPTRPQQCVRYG